jgi:hypothetical protein
VKKKIIALGIVLALLLTVTVPMAVMAGSGDTTVTGNFESITITAPTGQSNLVLTTSTADISLVTDTGNVTSTVAYDVTVKDKMEDSKASGDAGQMVSWASSSYDDGVKIADVVRVNTTHGSAVVAGLPHDVTASDFTIIDAASAATSDDLLITVLVDTASESALNPPSVYKITLTFTASADS